MHLGLYGTTLASKHLFFSVFKVSLFGRMANRGMGSRAANGNSLTNQEQGKHHLWNEDDFPSLSDSISSKPASKRRTRIDLGTCRPSRQKSESVQKTSPSQVEASSSISHQYDTDLPANFGKKRTTPPPRNRKAYYERGESEKKGLNFSSRTTVDGPFDICFPEIKKSNTHRRQLGFEKDSGNHRWVLKVQPDEENEQLKGSIEDSVEETGQVLRPGMVLFKHYIPISEQVDIVNKCRELGCGPGGFYRPGYEDGAKLRLHMMCLGRDWNPQTRKYGKIRQHDNVAPPDIPYEFASLVGRVISDSHSLIKKDVQIVNVEGILPAMSPDLCIVNFYTTTGRLGLHQDRDESKESLSKGLPVVSISIGDAAEFLYSDYRDVDKAERVLLESGDVLVFGGESRHIFHGINTILRNTAPSALLERTRFRPGRLNLTFRKY